MCKYQTEDWHKTDSLKNQLTQELEKIQNDRQAFVDRIARIEEDAQS